MGVPGEEKLWDKEEKEHKELEIPEIIPDEGILLGWSLEHEHKKPPIGFSYSEHVKDSPPKYLEPILQTGEGHIMTIASTGAGKGIGCVIPTLLRCKDSVIIIDPKGENAAVTARHREAMGQQVVIIDPFRTTNFDFIDTLNPMDLLQMDSPNLVEDAAVLAELAVMPMPSLPDPFWDDRAIQLITGLILHVATARPPVLRNLSEVRYLLNQSPEDMTFTAKEMTKSKNEEVRQMASILTTAEIKVRASIISTAQNHMECFRGTQVQNAISNSSFKLDDVTDGKPMTIYIVIPPDKLSTHAQLLRLWIGVLMTAITRRRKPPELNTLFMLDEAAQLGQLRQLRQATTLLRGYGLKTWSFWQDLSQLKSLYPNDWETMYNNCKVIQYFGMNNMHVARTVKVMTGYNNEYELLDLDADEMLLCLAGDECVIAQRSNYLTDRPFSGMFDDNPYHTELDMDAVRARYPQRYFRREYLKNEESVKTGSNKKNDGNNQLDVDPFANFPGDLNNV